MPPPQIKAHSALLLPITPLLVIIITTTTITITIIIIISIFTIALTVITFVTVKVITITIFLSSVGPDCYCYYSGYYFNYFKS